MSGLLVVHAAATWFMVGLIWMVQIVHYPLFAFVPPGDFTRYEAAHTRRMGRLLLIPATVEVGTAAALAWSRPDGVGLAVVVAAGVVLAGLWVTTVAVQVPLHRALTEHHSSNAIGTLVRSNWMRTAGWSLRGVLVSAMMVSAI